MDNKTTPDDTLFIDVNSEEHAILYHTTGEDDEYVKYMTGLFEEDKRVI